MKRMQYLLAAVLLCAAVLFGLFLPELTANVQADATGQASITYEMDAVSIDFEKALNPQEKLTLINESSDWIELNAGRYMNAGDVRVLCNEFLQTVFKQTNASDDAGIEESSTNAEPASPMLAVSAEEGSTIFWIYQTQTYSDFFGYLQITFYVDDATGQIFSMGAQGTRDSMFNSAWNDLIAKSEDLGSAAAGLLDAQMQRRVQSFLAGLLEALRKNWGYESVNFSETASDFSAGGITSYEVYFWSGDDEVLHACLSLEPNSLYFGAAP